MSARFCKNHEQLPPFSCLWLEDQHFHGIALSHLAQQELPILFPLISPVVVLNNTMEYLCVSVRSKLLSKTHRKKSR